jgi:hypothetical protein
VLAFFCLFGATTTASIDDSESLSSSEEALPESSGQFTSISKN